MPWIILHSKGQSAKRRLVNLRNVIDISEADGGGIDVRFVTDDCEKFSEGFDPVCKAINERKTIDEI